VGRGDPKRLFANIPGAFVTAVSYGAREYAQLGDKKVRLFFKGDMMPPPFHEGLLSEALTAMAVKGTVTSKPQGPDVAEYLIEWG
jgi:uncharacterized protein (TIGR02265 family)